MAKIFFWASLIAVFYTYFGYIALCVLFGRLFPKKFKKADICPFVSVIVPCYNEEKVIGRKIENLLALDYPKDKLQIIVASESTDNTDAIVSGYKDRGVTLYSSASRVGKTALMFSVVPAASGEILVFTDANVMLKEDSVRMVARDFADERVGAVAGAVVITNPLESDISWGEDLYKKYETLLRKANSSIGKVLNSDGALFALRKGLYSAINPDRGDDFELFIRILLQRYFCVFEPEALSYEEASVTSRAETTRKIRMTSWFITSTRMLLAEMLGKARPLLALQAISHKVMRWFTPFFFIALFLSTLALSNKGFGYWFFFLLQALTLTAGLAGWYVSGVQKKRPSIYLRAPHYFLMYNYAFFVGIIKGLFSSAPSAAWGKVRE